MQLGFVLDQSRCIGCHACTVACKSENDVPVGDFRTWVKYTEEGEWPQARRSFTVLRCNQCTEPPCVEICPVTALDKHENGVVEVDPEQCIGCKACMQGCPYDALYLNESKGVAEKCHFCAHRTEIGLAPACAVVCPTEAIVPGDFHDESSRVSALKREHQLTVRKEQAGTQPNVFYRDASAAGTDPLLTSAAHGFIWSQQLPGERLDAAMFDAMEAKAAGKPAGARTVYDVERKPLWGLPISAYLFFKSLAAGVFLAGAGFLAPARDAAEVSAAAPYLVPGLALAFLGLTLGLLVLDLKRPERFIKIMIRPNWDSWLAKGSFVITAYALALLGWLVRGAASSEPGWLDVLVTGGLAVFTAVYTAWLFAQAKGRVLWMKRGFALHLFFQAALAGAAGLLIVTSLFPTLLGDGAHGLDNMLKVALFGHAVMTLLEPRCAPLGREAEYARAERLLSHGPYKRMHWGGLLLGVALPLVLLLAAPAGPLWAVAGLAALVGLFLCEHAFVKAGQALPIS